MPKVRKGEMTMKQKLVAEEYANPESQCFLNATASYMKVNKCKIESARAAGSMTINTPKVKNYVAQLLEDAGFGLSKRTNQLREIGSGMATRIEKRVLADGEIISYEVTPTFAERLKAIEIANKIDGTADMGRNYADHEKEEIKRLEETVLAEFRTVN